MGGVGSPGQDTPPLPTLENRPYEGEEVGSPGQSTLSPPDRTWTGLTPPREQTNMSENITFPRTTYVVGNKAHTISSADC